MRDFRSAYPDRECVEGYVVTDRRTVMLVQGFDTDGTPAYVWCPEHGWSIPRTSFYATFEEAKAAAIEAAKKSLRWAEDALDRAQQLERPVNDKATTNA